MNTGFFTSTQLNIARPERDAHGLLEGMLSSSLGDAGISHRDMHDHGPSLTAMFNFGHLPELHPGYFFLMELGAYTELNKYTLLAFSGLQTHGGSPPRTLSKDSPLAEDAVRLTFIAYPSRGAMEKTEATVLAMGNMNGSTVIELDGKLDGPSPNPQIPDKYLNMV